MRFVVLFEDNPAVAEARTRVLPEHQRFLLQHADAILEAGPPA